MTAWPGSTAEARLSGAGIGAVLALHGAVLWMLLQMQVITLPAPLAVLSVSLLAPPAPVDPAPEIVLPKPRPIEKRPTPQPVQQPVPLAMPSDAPVAVAAPAVAVPVAVPPAPTFAPPAAPAPSPPRFDADYLDNPKPPYPGLSRRLREQGRVVLHVRVAASGLPLDVQLHAGSGSSRLDQAALDTVRRWKFVPARLGSDAVAATVLVPIVFSLKD